jgi:hypothetical protein
VNPEDAAAARFRPIAKAREQIAKTEQAHAAALARLEALRGQLAPAERRDRERLGEALVEGKREPLSEAEAIRAEVAQQELRVDALRLAADRARRQIAKLVDANRAGWRRQAQRELEKASSRYERAISELESARDGLSDEAALVGWLDGGAGIEAASDRLGGRVGDADGRAPLSFTAVVAELRRDGAAIAAHPVTRHEPHPHVASEHVKVGAMLEGWGGE